MRQYKINNIYFFPGLPTAVFIHSYKPIVVPVSTHANTGFWLPSVSPTGSIPSFFLFFGCCTSHSTSSARFTCSSSPQRHIAWSFESGSGSVASSAYGTHFLLPFARARTLVDGRTDTAGCPLSPRGLGSHTWSTLFSSVWLTMS
jgi:hypothetical protein